MDASTARPHPTNTAAVADAIAAVERAHEAFGAWSGSGPSERRALIHRVAELLEARQQAFVAAMCEETGTSAAWAAFNVGGALGALREAAALVTQIAGEVLPSDKPGCLAMTVRVPVGVVVGIAPWNAPLLLGLRAVLMPIACGNTVVLKSSEVCPRTHRMIAALFADAGFPAHCLSVVESSVANAAAVVEALIAHPAVRRLNFTGSTKVGRIIAEVAGRHLKPVLLELGGKAPFVVLADADLDQAVAAASFGAFMNQGQICMSTERIVVDASIADAFVERLARRASGLPYLDDADDARPALGAMIGVDAADRVDALVQDAVGKGARVHDAPGRRGTTMRPIVLDAVTPDMAIYTEESFGPVASIVRVSGEDEAVRVANDTEYGLAAAVHGRDIARTLRVAQRIDCGVCHINGSTVSSEPQLPFGGVKASGYGRFGGKAAIAEFTDLRLITIQTQPQRYPL